MKALRKPVSSLVKQVSLGIAASTLAVAASAAPIATFNFTQEFEFTSWTPAPPGVIGSGGVPAIDGGVVAGFTQLQWGVPSNNTNSQSSLVINAGAGQNLLKTGSINVSQDINALVFVNGPTLTHNNFVITGSSLTTATATDRVVLTPALPDVGAAQVQQIAFTVKFEETPNNDFTTNDSTCAAKTQAGFSAWSDAFGCGDIFALGLGQLVPTVVNTNQVAFLIDTFNRDGFKYDVYLQESAGTIGLLTNEACGATGSANGCVGFVTKENESTSFQLTFAILATEREIPAPGTLFLLGGSLLSLGWFRRRKAAA